MVKASVKDSIEAAIKRRSTLLEQGEARFVVERSGSYEHGDYATNAAFIAAKILKKNPLGVRTSNSVAFGHNIRCTKDNPCKWIYKL